MVGQANGSKGIGESNHRNFLESFSAKGGREMGHWLEIKESSEGFVQIWRILSWVSMLMTMTCRREALMKWRGVTQEQSS